MTDKKRALRLLEEDYVSKVYGFSISKINTREDAEDLTQEIVYQVLRAIRSDREIGNFNALVWTISNRTFFNWLRSKKRGSTMYLTELHPSDENIEDEYARGEQKALLSRELALISRKYRDAVVMHYFDGKSCEEIGQAFGKSSGTVKWWLHDARKFIKEGMNTMREYGEKSYKPGSLQLSCQCQPGADEEPMSCVKRKSAQNILLAAYKEPVSVERLCLELGISAPYIEDEVTFLVDNHLMKEMSSGLYQTDFVILPGHNANIANKIYSSCFPGYYNELMEMLEDNKAMLSSGSFNTSIFSWERLLWVYIHMITDICLCRFKREDCKIVMYDDIPDRPNGGKWIALGFENGFFFEPEQDWKEYHPFDGPVHKGGNDFAQGFLHYWSGLDSSVFFRIPDGVFALCRDVVKGGIFPADFNDEQKYLFSISVEKKLFVRTDSGFRQNYYFVSESGRREIEKLADSFYSRVRESFKTAYALVLNEYMSDVPKHLHWQMGNFLSNHLNNFVTCSLYEAVNVGKLSSPDEYNREWLSLFASE